MRVFVAVGMANAIFVCVCMDAVDVFGRVWMHVCVYVSACVCVVTVFECVCVEAWMVCAPRLWSVISLIPEAK